jgi:hypothetical protein
MDACERVKEKCMLNWPGEGVRGEDVPTTWSQSESNVMLDFHGDPRTAGLSVFSDGNHHMALEEALQSFRDAFPEVGEVFYATTPPGPVVELLRGGRMKIGNFILSARPHLFLCPPQVLDRLVAEGHMAVHRPFVKNRGSALLVPKGNPKRIVSVTDLTRNDVRLFLSNPETETVSYKGYVDTLRALAVLEGCDVSFLSVTASNRKICFGRRIHHREAPEALAAGIADAAVVYYHLALRYVRVFPEIFDMVSIGGSGQAPDPANVIGFTHAGLIGEGGRWGRACLDFLFTPQVARIYRAHGLDPLFETEAQV